MAKAEETVLEIDLKALEHNYKYLRSKLLPNTKFLAVVKAFAYGSDPAVIAMTLKPQAIWMRQRSRCPAPSSAG